ncbi:MAG: aminotransferase class I/II-fold pyridoxal phosphate-dependent enzyme [Acidimicrobiales bacterium]
MSSPAAPVLLHATATPRQVLVGGDDAAVRESATAQVATMLGDPSALVLTASCSAALDAAASLLDLSPGDEVVVPAFTFPTTAAAFAARGATLRFADADPVTANVDPASVLERLGPQTRAVVVTHYAGVAVDLGPLRAPLADRGIDLVEDAAHGTCAAVDGTPLGRLGRFAALSFHRTKNLSSVEGGALVANDAADAARILVAVDKGTNRVAFERGEVPSYEWSGLGSGWRMPEAAVRYLAEELPDLAAHQARRHEVVACYDAALGPWAAQVGATLPVVPPGRTSPAHLYHVVLPADRSGFVAHCAARGVQVARHYGSLPESAYGRRLVQPGDACPGASVLGERLVRIPLHHDLDDAAVARVVDAVTSWRP